MACNLLIPVTDVSSIGEVRRAVQGLASVAKLNDTDAGRASIVATELATNLVRHAKPSGGMMLLGADERATDGAIEMWSLDTGPGMGNVARCFEDGYSTGGTPGNGLGAVRRLADEHDLYSSTSGTVLWCRIIAAGSLRNSIPQASATLRAGGLSVAAPGETVCGDAWRLVRSDDSRISLLVADGLGHGPVAAEASQAALQSFDSNPFNDPAAILAVMHAAIGGTRGAAVAVAQIDPGAGRLMYAGVGNIAGTLISADGSSRGLFSHNGTVGHVVRKIQPFEYPWTSKALLVLHSDGLQTRWTLDKYPGLARRHPTVIAGALFRDFRRGRDDATVVVVHSSSGGI